MCTYFHHKAWRTYSFLYLLKSGTPSNAIALPAHTHSFCIYITCECMLSHFNSVRVCDPMDCRPPGSSVHGILQAGILEWVAMPSSRGSFPLRDQTCISYVSFIGRWFFTTSSTRESPYYLWTCIKYAKNTVNHQKLPLTEHLFCEEHVLNVLLLFSNPSIAKIPWLSLFSREGYEVHKVSEVCLRHIARRQQDPDSNPGLYFTDKENEFVVTKGER